MIAMVTTLLLGLLATGYVCPPCYHVDNLLETASYEHDGRCPVCGMNLVERRTLLDIDKVDIHAGSGNFVLGEGLANPDKPVFVFYHRPAGFSADSPILILVPGAGRNAWDYRDAWIDVSESRGVLILAPAYDASQYDFAAYHLGGIVTDLELRNLDEASDAVKRRRYHLRDEDIVFEVNNDPAGWIFRDFDTIFERAVAATGSNRGTYDIFGHSAGGQILHRLALFAPDSKTGRIVAANAGFYTVPAHEVALPFGLAETDITDDDLVESFSKDLVLLLGAADDQSETRGTMLHTPNADRQGLGRLSRGRFFLRESRQKAESLGTDFNWCIEVVDGVGHDFRRMGAAAAEYLYGPGPDSYSQR
jgi:pimeloyl-ACP methyl ester carboxylesterase